MIRVSGSSSRIRVADLGHSRYMVGSPSNHHRMPRLGEQLLVFVQGLHRKVVHARVAEEQLPLIIQAVGEQFVSFTGLMNTAGCSATYQYNAVASLWDELL